MAKKVASKHLINKHCKVELLVKPFDLVNLIMSKLNSTLFIFYAAKEYFENGTNYASKYFKINKNGLVKPFDSVTHAKLCVPASNISFSLELVFKALLMNNGVKKNLHDLYELYILLPIEIKQKIILHYKNHNTYKDFVRIRLIESQENHHGEQQIVFNTLPAENFIPFMLETHKSAFINFRYLHEFNEKEEWYFFFKEFSNLTFSALTILGESLNLKVVSVDTSSK
ncbi:hypothetical protein GALL_55360 [mine drainage metagenome]|uniref:Uncharacterized protein n=1 Tax=mine drainage metagenome TaxID=410659 RepID=A0A1J5TA74_9ZZZZ